MATLTCIPGREVVVTLRHRKTGATRTPSIVCPAKWTKTRLLEYVRSCHPNETVRILKWEENRWDTRLWIVNPYEMRL